MRVISNGSIPQTERLFECGRLDASLIDHQRLPRYVVDAIIEACGVPIGVTDRGILEHAAEFLGTEYRLLFPCCWGTKLQSGVEMLAVSCFMVDAHMIILAATFAQALKLDFAIVGRGERGWGDDLLLTFFPFVSPECVYCSRPREAGGCDGNCAAYQRCRGTFVGIG